MRWLNGRAAFRANTVDNRNSTPTAAITATAPRSGGGRSPGRQALTVPSFTPSRSTSKRTALGPQRPVGPPEKMFLPPASSTSRRISRSRAALENNRVRAMGSSHCAAIWPDAKRCMRCTSRHHACVSVVATRTTVTTAAVTAMDTNEPMKSTRRNVSGCRRMCSTW